MGFVRDRAAEGLWMTLNGGAMQMSTTLPEGTSDPVFSDTAIKSGGYGIIDVAWKVGGTAVKRHDNPRLQCRVLRASDF